MADLHLTHPTLIRHIQAVLDELAAAKAACETLHAMLASRPLQRPRVDADRYTMHFFNAAWSLIMARGHLAEVNRVYSEAGINDILSEAGEQLMQAGVAAIIELALLGELYEDLDIECYVLLSLLTTELSGDSMSVEP